MPRFVIDNYSEFYHFATKTAFKAVKDEQNGRFVAVAEVGERTAEILRSVAAFREVNDVEWQAMSTAPVDDSEGDSETGDPLADAAKTAADKSRTAAKGKVPNAPAAPALPITPDDPAKTDGSDAKQANDADMPPPPPAS